MAAFCAIDRYHAAKLEAEFEAAFAAKFTEPRAEPRAHEPVKPLTPWFLDKDSGGPNPLFRKPGIRYQD